jgi:50S ribosomal protein L16 3-hydroxylase
MQFLDEYWPDRAAFIPASQRRLNELLPTLSVTSIVSLVENYPAPIHAVSSGNKDGAQHRMATGRAALAALDDGATLCLSGVHTVLPEARDLLAALAADLGLPPEVATQCNGYTSPAGEGVPWHFDDREVFVLQVQGSKRWTLAVNREVPYPSSNFVLSTGAPRSTDELSGYAPNQFTGPLPDDEREVLLQPGSVLFMPRGTWHRTTAHEPSLSLTFGLFLPTMLDVILTNLRSRHLVDPRFRRPIAQATPSQVDQSRTSLVALLRDMHPEVAVRASLR